MLPMQLGSKLKKQEGEDPTTPWVQLREPRYAEGPWVFNQQAGSGCASD